MVEIRSKFERVRGMNLGKVGPHGILSDIKQYGSRQKAVTAELKSRGTMYGVGIKNRYEAELTNQCRGWG